MDPVFSCLCWQTRGFMSEQQQSPWLESLSSPSPSSSMQPVCPLLVRRGTGSPAESPAGGTGRVGYPHFGQEQSPEPSAPLQRTGPGRDAPPKFAPLAGRSRPEVWASPAGGTWECHQHLSSLRNDVLDYINHYVFVSDIFVAKFHQCTFFRKWCLLSLQHFLCRACAILTTLHSTCMYEYIVHYTVYVYIIVFWTSFKN